MLVEASPFDKTWGVGLSINDNDINDKTTWKGQNILGSALMKARKTLKSKINYLTIPALEKQLTEIILFRFIVSMKNVKNIMLFSYCQTLFENEL